MTIAELIQTLPINLSHGSAETVISDIVEDSRRAGLGCMFVARDGAQFDGRRFIGAAVKAGAVAVLTDHATVVPQSVVALRTNDVAGCAAHLAERLFGNPSRVLRLIGITGTNGKTTVAHLVQQLLAAIGRHCGMIGTVAVHDGQTVVPGELTTPSAIEISRILGQMVANGCDSCVMEVSSHALQQGRAAALDIDIAVFTNLSGDHLDYHGTMDKYARAKAKLFRMLRSDGHAVVNNDDAHWSTMIEHCDGAVHQCSFGNAKAECVARIAESTIAGTPATFRIMGREFDVQIPLIGRHNVMNALQAVAVAHLAGSDSTELCRVLAKCTAPPGRFERVATGDAGFTILVDYAHTDDALDNALGALRPLVPNGSQLHVVFGCGGDRDRSKRPRMAAVACRWADQVYITSDNPRTENPQAIVDEIAAGVPQEFLGRLLCDVDRSAAIRQAIHVATPGDVVLIAGKGHEDYQIIGTTKRPFDDRITAAQAVAACREVCA